MKKNEVRSLFRVTTGTGKGADFQALEGLFFSMEEAKLFLTKVGDGTGRIQSWSFRLLSEEGSDCD